MKKEEKLESNPKCTSYDIKAEKSTYQPSSSNPQDETEIIEEDSVEYDESEEVQPDLSH